MFPQGNENNFPSWTDCWVNCQPEVNVSLKNVNPIQNGGKEGRLRKKVANYFIFRGLPMCPNLMNLSRVHPGLTRVSGIRFLLFEIKSTLVYNLTIF